MSVGHSLCYLSVYENKAVWIICLSQRELTSAYTAYVKRPRAPSEISLGLGLGLVGGAGGLFEYTCAYMLVES